MKKKMKALNQIKFPKISLDRMGIALMSIPLLVGLTACTGQMDVEQKKDSLASRDATHSATVVMMPDSRPSVGDGSVYWKQANCASCHGATGTGVPGKCDLDLTNVEWMRSRKPNEQYKAVAYGEGVVTKMPVLSSEGETENMDPVMVRTFEHPEFASKFDKRVLWNLIFYSRSLATPMLSAKEHADMKAVFGANCAVCHGTRGAGDGPLNKGLVLQPNPANFNQFNRFYDRTDEQIWDHIAHGIKWEGMPNFLGKEDKKNKVKFDAEYIWKLTQYIRHFHEMPEFELEKPPVTADASTSEKKMETEAAPEEKDSTSETAPVESKKESTNKEAMRKGANLF